MQIDNQIASRRRRSGRANSNHIPDGTAHATLSLLQPPPHLPCEHRDDEPRSRSEDEGPGGRRHDHQPDHKAEAASPKASEGRSGSIERRGFLAAPRSRQTRFLLALPDMLFDQRRACGKDRGKRKKQAAAGGAEAGRDEACDYGDRPAEHKSDEILVPARLTKGGKLELNDHESRNRAADRPNATTNQTTSAAIVALHEDSRNFLSNTHTVQL